MYSPFHYHVSVCTHPQISFSSADIFHTTTSFYPELPRSSITAMSSDSNVSSQRKREDTDQGTAVVAMHLAQTNGTALSIRPPKYNCESTYRPFAPSSSSSYWEVPALLVHLQDKYKVFHHHNVRSGQDKKRLGEQCTEKECCSASKKPGDFHRSLTSGGREQYHHIIQKTIKDAYGRRGRSVIRCGKSRESTWYGISKI